MGNFLSTSGSVLGPSVPSSDGDIVAHGVFSEPYPSSSSEARYPLAVKADFHLPLAAASLFFAARGASSGGAVIIREESEDGLTAGGATAEVRVKVEALFRDIDDLEHMIVVRLSRQDGAEGVGVYTPSRPFIPRPPLIFHTTITLPPTAPASLYEALTLTTTTANTSHSIHLPTLPPLAALSLTTSNQPIVSSTALHALSRVDLTSSNGEVRLESDVSSPSISVRTSNQPVKGLGTWRADKTRVTTSNAAVDLASVLLPSRGARLEVISSNKAISLPSVQFTADPTTASASSTSSSKIETSNAPIRATLTATASVNSVARTSNAAVEVIHAGLGWAGAKYEGRTSGAEGVKVTGPVGVKASGNVDGRSWGTVDGVGASAGGKTEVVSSNGGVVLKFE